MVMFSLIRGAIGYALAALQYTVHLPAQLDAPLSAAVPDKIIDIGGRRCCYLCIGQAHALGRVGAGHIGDLVVSHETGAQRGVICGKLQANIGCC